jgi:RNA polymerase sigma factor (TIGR02999 family)
LRLAHEQVLQMGCRQQFFGLASSVMRHVLVDHARARRAAKRDAGTEVRSLDTAALSEDPQWQAALAVADDTIDLVALDEALQRLERLDAQQARVVEMRFFAGMSVEATADALQLSPTTVKREWATARAWLLRELDIAAPVLRPST